MISHGIAAFLKERLFDASDAYRLHVCDMYVLVGKSDQAELNFYHRCGLTAIANLKKQSFECRSCKNKTACSQLYIPYAAKLLIQASTLVLPERHFSLSAQELQSMNIAARMYAISTGRIRDV